MGVDDSTILEYEKTPWGLFDIVYMQSYGTSEISDDTIRRAALLGLKHDFRNQSLYVQNERTPLLLVGDSRISGDVYASKQGIWAGSLGDMAFTHNVVVDGVIKTSDVDPIEYDKNLSLRISETLKHARPVDLTVDSIVQSFGAESIKINGTDILINGWKLKGNICVEATSSIRIIEGSTLENIILSAPTIYIDDNVKISAQIYASHSLVIGDGCEFEYPSILGLMNHSHESKKMYCGKNCVVEGTLLAFDFGFTENPSEIILDDEFKMYGELYTNGAIGLTGRIEGSVTCRRVFYRTNGEDHYNYIVNTEIKPFRSAETHCRPIIMSPSSGKSTVAKWL